MCADTAACPLYRCVLPQNHPPHLVAEGDVEGVVVGLLSRALDHQVVGEPGQEVGEDALTQVANLGGGDRQR